MKPSLPLVHSIRKVIIAALLPLFLTMTVYCQDSPVNAVTNVEKTSSVLTNHVVGDRSPADISMLKVYPNPVIDEASLVFNAAYYNTPYEIRIVNNSGIVVRNLQGITSQGQNTVNLHMGDFAPGNYYVQITTPSAKETLRFLK